jgi:F-type H+-transporting ATPase subunit epsilon
MAENNLFELNIIAPDAAFYHGEADFLEFTSVIGQMGVYKDHIPLTTILQPCVMTIHNGDEVKKAAVLGGFVEILKKKITVLAEEAQWPEEIDVERAKAAKARAKERLERKDEGTDLVRAEAALRRAVARIETAKK